MTHVCMKTNDLNKFEPIFSCEYLMPQKWQKNSPFACFTCNENGIGADTGISTINKINRRNSDRV